MLSFSEVEVDPEVKGSNEVSLKLESTANVEQEQFGLILELLCEDPDIQCCRFRFPLFVIKSDGFHISSFGDDKFFQLGTIQPSKVRTLLTSSKPGKLLEMNSQVPMDIKAQGKEEAKLERIECVSGGKMMGAYVSEKGDLYTWGIGLSGELGISDFQIARNQAMLRNSKEDLTAEEEAGL